MLDIKSYLLGKKAGGGSSGGGGNEGKYLAFVDFMSEDGKTLLYKMPVVKGDTAKNPIETGVLEEPTKEATVANTFSFLGWASTMGGSVDEAILENVTENKVVFAVFETLVRYYTVNFYDGETLLNTEQVAYGGSSSYVYNKTDYLFNGWSPKPLNVTSDLNCVGSWIVDDGYIHDDWDVISQSVADGTYKTKYALGDLKQVSVVDYDGTTRVLDMEIVAFDHDDLTDGSGKAGITFLSTELLKIKGLYAPSSNGNNYWWGNPNYQGDFQLARDWLNNSSAIYNGFPDTLKNSVKSVAKQSQKYDLTLGKTSDKVWIPSMTEIGLTTSSGITITEGQGNCYSYKFTDNESRRRYQPNTTNYYSWVTRTRFNQTGNFLGVDAYGKTTSVSVKYSDPEFSLIGFCI